MTRLPVLTGCPDSGRQALAALGAAPVDNNAASFGRHARTKSMAAFAYQVARLKSAFHLTSPSHARHGGRAGASVATTPVSNTPKFETLSLGNTSAQVNSHKWCCRLFFQFQCNIAREPVKVA